MYEKTGMGWSEVSWYQDSGMSCSGDKPREVCFPESEAHIAQANSCVENRTKWTNNRMPCSDGSRAGHVYCCRPGYPRPYYEQSTVTPPGLDPEIPPLPPIPEDPSDPTGGQRASFFEKLMHPGALLAIGTFSLAGVLGYYTWRNQ